MVTSVLGKHWYPASHRVTNILWCHNVHRVLSDLRIDGMHVRIPPTDPFVQGDAFGRLAHGLPPGDQLWPLHLQPAGEQIPASHVRSRVPAPRFLCIRKSCSKVLARNSPSRARDGRGEQDMSLTKKTQHMFGLPDLYSEKWVTCPWR